MKKRFDIIALGEVLVDFTQSGFSENGMRLFEQNPGGAPANMLTAALQANLKTSFIGKIGSDMHGKFLRDTLTHAGIDVSGLLVDPDTFTTLAFVSLNEKGEREFSFARKPGADTQIHTKELDVEMLQSTRVLHVGSLSLTDSPAREATLEAVRIAREAGAIISYDPNYRASLWDTVEDAKKWMGSLVAYADIMKLSDEEAALLTPYSDPEKAAKYLLEQGVKIVTVTLGADGAMIAYKYGTVIAPGFRSKVVDTTGAGDSFFGGFVSKLLTLNVDILNPKESELYEAGRYGNAVASLCVERRGGITGIPTTEEIEERLQRG